MNTSCVRTQSSVGNSKCLQGPHLLLKAASEFIIALMDSSLLPQTQLQPHCLSFQANTTLLSPASKNHLPKPPASKSILWLCLLGKLARQAFPSTSTLPVHHYCCCCCFHFSTLILLPRMPSTTAFTSYLPFSKSKLQKTSSSTVPERLVFRLPDHHKLITY